MQAFADIPQNRDMFMAMKALKSSYEFPCSLLAGDREVSEINQYSSA